jgi:hypothetical protein
MREITKGPLPKRAFGFLGVVLSDFTLKIQYRISSHYLFLFLLTVPDFVTLPEKKFWKMHFCPFRTSKSTVSLKVMLR